MTDSASATALAHSALDAIAAREPARLLNLLAENAVMNFPFSPEGFPAEAVGRDTIIDRLGVLPQFFAEFEITNRKVMATDAGEVVIEADGRAKLQSGGDYRNSYVMIFEVRDGAIVRWSEYNNPLMLAALSR